MHFKVLSFISILLLSLTCYSQDEDSNDYFFEKVSLLELKKDSLDITEVITIFNSGDSFKPMENSIFYELKDNAATWFHFKLDSITNNQIFTIWNNYLDYSKVYLKKKNGDLIEKREYSLLEKGKFDYNTRKPYWKFTTEESNSDVFIKLKDYDLKTNLNFYLLSPEEHNLLLGEENLVIILQSFFLLFLFIFVLIIALARKQISLLWYSIYILFFLLLYFVNSGLHIQFNIIDIPVFQPVSQVFITNNSMFFACLFFISFYKYNKDTQWVKKAFKYISHYFAIVFLVFMVFFVFNITLIDKEFIIYSSRLIVIFILLLHIYLAVNKTIPYYLAFAFNLPIISFFIFINDDPTFSTSFEKMLFIDNLLYIATTIEILIVVFYIVKSLINIEIKAVKLKNENLTLRNSFKDSILEAQELEKSALFANVSDSFGGYIKALKARLTPNGVDKYDVKDLLDNLNTEYQNLLNNLYAPKINSKNLTDHLTDFINKQNGLVNYIIKHDFAIENLQLSSEKSIHLYRIVAELITNAIKHSGASAILIKIYQNENNDTIISVSDNGIGFSLEEIDKNALGIKNIEQRVNEMNGELHIDSKKNKGSTITIIIPNK